MNAETLLQNFDVLVEATDGIDNLRTLLIDFGIRGLLTGSNEFGDNGFPISWKVEKFKDYCDIEGGNQPPKSSFSSEPKHGYIRLFQIRDLGSNPVPVYIPTKSAKSLSATGDILIGRYGASVGKVFYAQDGAYNVALVKFVFPKNELISEFVYWMLRSSRSQAIFSGMSRSAQAGFNKRDLAVLDIPAPSINEQKLIITKINDLMTLCDQLEQLQRIRDNLRVATRKSAIDAISTATTPEELEAAWKRINNNWDVIADTPESIDSLRELILDLAVRGDLGITDISDAKAPTLWDVEEQKLDVDKLWKLDTMHVNPANGWSRLPLARLGTWGSGGTPTASRKEFYNNGSIPWAVIGDLNNGIMTDTSSKITEKALASSSAKLIPKNAVLIAMYGASIGKTAVTGIECTTNQAIAHCIVDESVVSTEYFFLVAKSLKKHLIKVGKGAAQPNISQTVLKHLLIDVPHLDAQRIVVTKVDELMALCDQIEQQQDNRDNLAKKFSRSIVSID